MSTIEQIEKVIITTPFIPCSSCNAPIDAFQIPSDFIIQFFNNHPINCNACGNAIDWWLSSLKTLNQHGKLFSQGASLLLGATSLFITKIVPLFGHIEIDLKDYKIPDNCTILYVNYTPIKIDHAYIPLNWNGNEPFPNKIPRRLLIYGIPMPLGKAREVPNSAQANELNISITYVPHNENEYAVKNLSKAYKAFLEGDFEDMVIPACVAVEDTLKQMIMSFFRKEGLSTRRQDVENLLLQTLPPLLSKFKLPYLPEKIQSLIINKGLYSLRNMLAHEGKVKVTITKERAAEILCAAIFVTRYLLSIRPIITGETQ